MKQLSIAIALCLSAIFFATSIHAQQFKWVTGGGTPQDFTTGTSWDQEATSYMCTDPNGNIYAISQVGTDGPIEADTFHRAGAYGANDNILITSYNCNGQMRWAKLITSSGGDCTPYGIIADSLGHIYVAGLLVHNAGSEVLYIGSDTVITGSLDLVTSLVQFDTTGHFSWIRFVGTNTLSTLEATQSYANPLVMDGVNNAHYFVYMKSGVSLMTGVTSQFGVYDMTYNTAGTLLSAVRLDLDSQWFLHGAVIDPVTNKLYVCGEVNQSLRFGIVDTFFAAAFDASRNQLWQYFCGHGDDDGITGVAFDPSRHLYFSGAAGPRIGETTFSFNGDSVSAPYYELSIILKTDTNGHVNWIKYFDSHYAVNYFNSVTLLPNYKIAVVGTYDKNVTNGIDSLNAPTGEYQNPYVVIVDSAGDLEQMQQLYADGATATYNSGNVIVSDRVGNMYVGGTVVDSIWGGTIRAYHSVGGNSDFFVMKYGVDCSCTVMPIAAYTDTGTHTTIGLTYTGTTSGVDSVVWNFDDGGTGTGTTALHTFSVSGTYRICVTVYTDCGEDLFCSNVTVVIPSEGISNVPGLANMKVWPNPASDQLNITGVTEKTNYRLLSVAGSCLTQGTLQQGSNTVPVKNLASGVYILELNAETGQRNMVRVVKE